MKYRALEITAPSGTVYLACLFCIERMASEAVRLTEDGPARFQANLHDFAWQTRAAFEEHVAMRHAQA